MSKTTTVTGSHRTAAGATGRTRRLWSNLRSYPGHSETPSELAVGCMTGVTNLRRR